MVKAGPHFTEQARAAAAVSRRKRAVLKAEAWGDLQVFAVRTDNRFTWEIRQYGGIVVLAADESFSSSAGARLAGTAALATMSRADRRVLAPQA